VSRRRPAPSQCGRSVPRWHARRGSPGVRAAPARALGRRAAVRPPYLAWYGRCPVVLTCRASPSPVLLLARRYKAPLPLRPARRPPPRGQPHGHRRHGRPPGRAPRPTGCFPQLNHPTPSLVRVDARRLAPPPHRAALALHWTATAAATPGCRCAARQRVPLPNSGAPPLLGGLGDLSGPSPANPAAGPAGILAGAAPAGREDYIARRRFLRRATAQKVRV
jgi:hypothetical protein